MASIYKRKRDKNRRGSYWYISYDDDKGKRRTKRGFTDKRATEQLANEIEQEVRRRKSGLVDPEEDFRREARNCEIELLLKEFEESLAATSPKHVSLTMSRIRKIVDGCGFESIVGASAEQVRKFMDVFKKHEDIGNKTYNHYLQAMDSFGNWLVATKRCLANPFGGISRLNTEVDVRHPRRALSYQEMVKLVKSARTSGKSIQTFDGETRARIYVLSYMTGLRRKELGSLTPENFDLESSPPTITVDAACSKHRKKDVLPLHPELAETCREWLMGLGPEDFLFPNLGKKKTWLMVKKDLERVEIPYQTKDGIADFHASGRHTHITELIRSGASLAEARELARHSDIRMTMRYAHIGLDDQAKAVGKLQYDSGLASNLTPKSNPNLCHRSASGTRHNEGHSAATTDNAGQSSDTGDQKKNPGKNRGSDVVGHNLSLPVTGNSKVEAAGIEPASRSKILC